MQIQKITLMKENRTQFLGYWLKRYLMEYLPTVKNLSINTIRSYRDAFRQLLPFVSKRLNKSTDELRVTDITDNVVIEYLYSVEAERHCSIQTRNQRLTAIHALAKYVGSRSPEHVDWCRTIRNIPKKKHETEQITYLEKEEMDALLELPCKNSKQGWRDYVMLLFLYNTGARVEEVANLRICDLRLPTRNTEIPIVKIIGKGRKERRTPLWDITVKTLKTLIDGRDESDYVFLSRLQKPISRFGIYEMVVKYGTKLAESFPNTKEKRISPHTIRHTTATHLLQAGVDINTIRAWLGHVSVDTTNIYAEVNLEMKAKALKTTEIKGLSSNKKKWKDDSIMSFLESL